VRERVYDFDERKMVEEEWAPVVKEWLEEMFGSPVYDVRELKLEFDFMVGDGDITFDLKADTLMHRTGNIFVETESDIEAGKPGWLYNTQVDYIIYLDTVNRELYLIPMPLLQAHEREIKTYPYKTVKNRGWTAGGHLVPVEVVKKWGIRSWKIRPART